MQARFRVVYGTQTFSNNNTWLRRKLLEGESLKGPFHVEFLPAAFIRAIPRCWHGLLPCSRRVSTEKTSSRYQFNVQSRPRSAVWCLTLAVIKQLHAASACPAVSAWPCVAAAGLQAPKAAGRGRPSARTSKAASQSHPHVQALDSPPLSRSSSLASQSTGNCVAAKADEVRRTKR